MRGGGGGSALEGVRLAQQAPLTLQACVRAPTHPPTHPPTHTTTTTLHTASLPPARTSA